MRKNVYTGIILIMIILSGVSHNSSAQNNLKFSKNFDKTLISVVVSGDNNYIASLSSDKIIRIFDINSGKVIKTLEDKGDGSVGLSYSPDSKSLITASADNTITVWDIESGNVSNKLSGHTMQARSVCYSTDGNFIISGANDNTIQVWDNQYKVNIKSYKGHKQSIRAIAVSPDGLYIASSGNDMQLKLWNFITGAEVFSVKASSFPVETVSYSPDGSYIATAGMENTVKIWDTKKGGLVKSLNGHSGNVYSVCFSPCGKYLASGGDDNMVKVWDVEKGTVVLDLKGHSKSIRSVFFSSDGKTLVSGGIDKTMKVWDVRSLNIKPLSKKQLFVKTIENSDLEWNPENKSITLNNQYTIKITVKNKNLTNFKLYKNKTLCCDNKNNSLTEVRPKMQIKPGSITELEYNVVLDCKENEFVFYAENLEKKSYVISQPLNVTFFNINEFRKTTRMKSIIVSPKNYSDKKLNMAFEINVDFETENTKRFVELCKNQQGKLFSSVTARFPEDNRSLSKKNLVKSIDSLSSSSGSNDLFLIIISGLFIKNTDNEIFYIAPTSNMKDFQTDLIKIDAFCNSINNSKAFSGIIVDPSRKLTNYPKGYSAVESKEIFDYISKSIVNRDNYAILVISSTEYLQLFDLLHTAYDRYNDLNKDKIIDFKELNTFINFMYSTNFKCTGSFMPLFIFEDKL